MSESVEIDGSNPEAICRRTAVAVFRFLHTETADVSSARSPLDLAWQIGAGLIGAAVAVNLSVDAPNETESADAPTGAQVSERFYAHLDALLQEFNATLVATNYTDSGSVGGPKIDVVFRWRSAHTISAVHRHDNLGKKTYS